MASALLGVHTGSTAYQLLLFRVPALRSHLHSGCGGVAAVKAAAHRPSHAASSTRRNFQTSRPVQQWRNETPPGGLTILHVFHPQTPRIWPDPVLGVFSAKDPRCCLPGNVGLDKKLLNKSNSRPSVTNGATEKAEESSDANEALEEEEEEVGRNVIDSCELFTRFTHQEHQARLLHSASDYLQHTEGSEDDVCNNILEAFPGIDGGMRNAHCQFQEAPYLLKKTMQPLFPDRDVINNKLSVITVAHKTQCDMTGWSAEVEDERERLVEAFVTAAKDICGRLMGEGYWSDFVDPTSGKPYFGAHTNSTLFETDESYRLLGFQIEDLGCCKVIVHNDYGRNVFVGTIVTEATVRSGVVHDMFQEIDVPLHSSCNDESSRTEDVADPATSTPTTSM